jgi:hypothetical protein
MRIVRLASTLGACAWAIITGVVGTGCSTAPAGPPGAAAYSSTEEPPLRPQGTANAISIATGDLDGHPVRVSLSPAAVRSDNDLTFSGAIDAVAHVFRTHYDPTTRITDFTVAPTAQGAAAPILSLTLTPSVSIAVTVSAPERGLTSTEIYPVLPPDVVLARSMESLRVIRPGWRSSMPDYGPFVTRPSAIPAAAAALDLMARTTEAGNTSPVRTALAQVLQSIVTTKNLGARGKPAGQLMPDPGMEPEDCTDENGEPIDCGDPGGGGGDPGGGGGDPTGGGGDIGCNPAYWSQTFVGASCSGGCNECWITCGPNDCVTLGYSCDLLVTTYNSCPVYTTCCPANPLPCSTQQGWGSRGCGQISGAACGG